MYKKSIFGLAIIAMAYAVVSCGGSSKGKKAENKDTLKVVQKDSIKINKKYTDIAKYISGMALDEKSDLFELTKEKSFIAYAKQSDSSWIKLEKKRLSKMKAWAAEELPALNKKIKTLFYAFSGPDFLHAQVFFPNTKKIIMFGLEPVGDIPDLKKIPVKKLPTYFNALNNSIEDALSLSFFKTIDMGKEFNTDMLKGSLPVIMLFVVRTGHEIINIKPTEIDSSGKMVYINSFKDLKGEESFNKGAEITYVDKGDTVIRKIIYFSANVADGGLKTNPNCTKFLKNIEDSVVTMLKSASYLMHNSYFSFVRNTILDKSFALLQDDSGISYKYFDQKKWDISLFGVYNGPINMFKNRFEKDLKEAYLKAKPNPLHFQYGYGTTCGLLLAKKK